MARLNKKREQDLQPKRLEYCKSVINGLGYSITYEDDTKIKFLHKGHVVTLYPYSGWYSGKSINDGRGIENLFHQLTN